MAVLTERNGQVQSGFFKRVAVAFGETGASGQGGDDFGAVGVVVHFLRRLVGIASHPAVGENYGNPRGRLLAEFFAEGVDLLEIGFCQFRVEQVLGQEGPGLQIGLCLFQAEGPERGGSVAGDCREGDQHDEQIGGIELPEQAFFAHHYSFSL